MSSAQDERQATIDEARTAKEARYRAEVAVNRFGNDIGWLTSELEKLRDALTTRWTDAPEHIRSYAENTLAMAEDTQASARLSLSAATTSLEARAFAQAETICADLSASVRYKTVACQVVVGFLDRFGYITPGASRGD